MTQSFSSTIKRARQALARDRWVKPYFKLYRKALIVSLLLGIIAMVFASALMFTSGYLISLSAERPEIGVWALFIPLAFVQIFGIGKPFLSFFERLESHDWILHMTSKLRLRLYLSVEKNAAFWSLTKRLGDTLGLLSEDTDHLQNLYLRTIFPTIIATAIWFIVTIALGIISPLIGLGTFIIVGIYTIALPILSVCVNGARQQRIKSHTNELYADVYDNVLGIADWTFSGRKDEFTRRVMDAHEAIHREAHTMHAFSRKRDFAGQTLFAFFVIGMCVWASYHFASIAQAPAAIGVLDRPADWIAAFVLGLFPLLEAFVPLSDAATQGFSHIDSIKRLNALESVPAILDEPSGVTQLTTAVQPEKTSNAAKDARIELKDVSFSYEGKPVLDSITLSIEPSEKLAILGPSGAGKSTLASLLRGDLVPTSGDITIGRENSAALADDIANRIGIIQQETYLFNATLLGNLRLGDSSITREQAQEALIAVGLEGLLNRLPKGLDTMVDEAGWRFSGGERHRIAIARVLLRQTPIIILDEPMVGLDPQTEHDLLSTILEVFANRTVIMITHHLLDIDRFDRVIFIEQSAIALEGTPANLAQMNDRFRKLLAFDQGVS
ncbi:MAG: thiol reductant ABC exporter subunit CydC [Eggerthellaceae bacterium]|nr:thiol reductant ABC exporter subunit CydC [Eggerthellaceae bacterium]